MSGYVTDANGVQDCIEISGEQVSIRNKLNLNIEEAGECIIPQVTDTVKDGSKRVMVLSNDADMVMLLLYFFDVFSEMGVEELWVTFGKGESYRVIPIHALFKKLGKQMCKILFIVHTLTSKIGTKQAALKCQFSQLVDFGSTDLPDPSTFRLAEGYLCSVLSPKDNCKTFDDSRYILYTKQKTPLPSLPPTSRMLHGNLLRCHYFVRTCQNLLSDSATNLLPERYGWCMVNSVLMPDKFLLPLPEEYTVTCGCKKKCSGRYKCQKSFVECTEPYKCCGKNC